MSAIDTAMLAAMRSAISELLPDTCNIVTITKTADGQGGWTESKGTSGTAIACRLDVHTGREMLTGGAVQPYIKTVLSLPYDTTITEVNRVEHGGITYAVIAPSNSDQSWIAVKRVELEKL